jgi:phage shock protein C
VSKRGFLSRVHRYPDAGWIAGVCIGLAEHFDWNVKLLRIGVLVGFFAGLAGPILIAYGLLWYLMDERRGHPSLYDGDPTPERTAGDPAPPRAPAVTMADLKGRFARLEDRLRGMEECVSSQEFDLRRELRKLES